MPNRMLDNALYQRASVATVASPVTRAGPRVLIRAHTPDDFPRMREIWSDPAVMRHMSVPPMTDEQAAAAFDALLSPDPFARRSHQFAIVQRRDDILLGTIGVDFERFSSAYTHSMVMHRESWGMGLAGEAYHLLLAFAFDQREVERIWTACATDNEAGRRLIERVGFTWFGTIRRYCSREGQAVDVHTFSYLHDEWRAHLDQLRMGIST